MQALSPNIPVQAPQLSPLANALEIFHKSLLVLTTVASVASVIPQIKTASILVVRSISLLNASTSGVITLQGGTALEGAAAVCKVAAVALGIVSMTGGMPVLIMASLVTDSASQVFEMIRALKQRRPEGFFHLIVAVTNLFIIGATVAYSPLTIALVIAAVQIQAIVMVTLAAYRMERNQDALSALCYSILAFNNIVHLLVFAISLASDPVSLQFKVKAEDKWFENQEEVKWTSCHGFRNYYSKPTFSSGVVHKGETIEFSVPFVKGLSNIFIHSDTPYASEISPERIIYPEHVPTYQMIIEQTIPVLPLLGPTIAFEHDTHEQRS